MSSILRSWLLALLVVAAPLSAGAASAPAKRATKRASPVAKPAASSPRAGAAARTLDDIHIEGEIPVPQVLFITARNQRRFLDFRHHDYLRSAQQLGEATAAPSRVLVVSSPVTPAKESSR